MGARIRKPTTPHLVNREHYLPTVNEVSRQIRDMYLEAFRYIEYLEGEVDRLEAELKGRK